LHRGTALNANSEDVVKVANVSAGRGKVKPPAISRPSVQLIDAVVKSQSFEITSGEGQDIDVAVAGAS
jgi:hypothetical protein